MYKINGTNITGNDESGKHKYMKIKGGQYSFEIITSDIPPIIQIINNT